MYLISYDISHNTKRNRLARYLAKFGTRLQKSVFIVNIPRYQFKQVLREIEKITGKKGDVAIFPLCLGCQKNARHLTEYKETCFIA